MTNEYIAVVKKWLADKASVSSEELRANADAAYVGYNTKRAADAAYAASAAAAALALYAARADARAADYWVKRYEELTNE